MSDEWTGDASASASIGADASAYIGPREGVEISPDALFSWVKSGIKDALTLGNTDFAQRLETILTWAVIIGVGYLLVQVIFLGKMWKEALSP